MLLMIVCDVGFGLYVQVHNSSDTVSKSMLAGGLLEATTLGFGSCLHHDRRPWTIFDEVASFTKLDHFLHLGDIIYVDQSNSTSLDDDISLLNESEHRALLKELYHGAFSDGPMSNLMMAAQVHFMWDDHEIYDNYDQGNATTKYTAAKQAFNEHVSWRNPPPRISDELYFNFTVGQGSASVFVLDARSFRSPLNMSDDSVNRKTMLGWMQLEELKSWLVETPQEQYKIIASSVMWNDQAGLADYLDGWAHYRRERDELFQFIANNSVMNVVLISADAHWSGVFYFPQYGIHEFSVSPLAAPALASCSHGCTARSSNSSLSSTELFVVAELEGLVGFMTIDTSALVFKLVHISGSGQQPQTLRIERLRRNTRPLPEVCDMSKLLASEVNIN